MADIDLNEMADADIRAAIDAHGSVRATAQALGIAKSTLQEQCHKRGIGRSSGSRGSSRRRQPTLTIESLHQALLPPNNCKVKTFLDALDDESRGVVEEALAYDKQDFPAASLRDWLIKEGFREQDVPGSDAVNDHRSGRRPCRCRG